MQIVQRNCIEGVATTRTATLRLGISRATAMVFCVFNQCALGLRMPWRPLAGTVAIAIRRHHGNGTEDISQ